MLTIPEEIKALFRSDNNRPETHKKFKLTFYDDTIDNLYPYETLFPDEGLFPAEHGEPWLVIENDRIVTESLQISESLSSDEDLIFGSCEGSEMQITVADVNQELEGKEFTLTVEIGGYQMALGIYTVKSFVRQSDRRKKKITAYDRMEWYNSLNFPITVKTFRDSLCDYIGIKQRDTNLILDSMYINKTIDPQQLSGTDVLKAICEINGCFAHVDKTGELEYVQLQQMGLFPAETLYPEESLYPSEVGSDGRGTVTISTYKQPMTYEDYLVEGINGLTIRQEEGDVGASVGENDNVYTIEGNFLLYGKSASDLLNIAQSILSKIYSRNYRPASLDCNCMPWIEVGDVIIVPTKDDIIETFVMKRTISGCQNMRDKIESTGSQKKEANFSVQKQIIQLEGKTAIIQKNVEEVSVSLSDLKEYTESQFSITAGQITAEVKRATEAEGELSSRVSVTAEQIELKVSKGDVSSQISVESGGINISGNRLTWTATNSSMSANGTLTCKNISATNGNFSGTISGSTISGSTISGSTITGNTISGGTVSGATINGSKIEASEIRASRVTATASLDLGVLSVKEITECTFINASRGQFEYLQCDRFDYYSDYRLKKDIKSIDTEKALSLTMKLRPVQFEYKKNNVQAIGFIAQEVEEAEKQEEIDWPLYGISDDGYYSIPYANYVALLAADIQQLNKELKILEMR